MKQLAMALMAVASGSNHAPHDGVYGNICLSAETGDQGGIELQIRTIGGQPSVTLKTCQGGCWEQPTSEVKVRGDRMIFLARDQAFDEQGQRVATTVRRFTAIFRDGAVIIESPGYYPPQRLKRQPWPVEPASPGTASDWPTPVRRCR